MPAHRVYTEPLADGSYRPSVRNHNPFAHAGDKRYDVPQIAGWRDDPTLMSAPKLGGPLRVFALVDRYPPQVNAGGEWMLHNLLTPLADQGATVDVVTATVDPYDLDGVTVWPRSAIAELADAADVMIGHLMWSREAVETAAATRTPLVYLAHNHRQLRHWSLTPDNVTVLVVNSRWLAEDIETPRRRGLAERDSHGVATWEGPSMVVRPPVRVADYQLERDPAAAEFVTMVNMTAQKGAHVFYALANEPPPRRWLAVEGGYGSQVHPGREHPSVEWQSQTPRIRDDVYARTRVLLMPSEYESWGRVGVEAMASGIPVVAHPTKGLQEALGPAGLFRDRNRPRDWWDALKALDDPSFYAAASDAAGARALELDVQAERDVARFGHAIRAAAEAGRVPSRRPHDSYSAGAP